MQKALENSRWIDHIYPPNSHAQVSEFADLREAIKDTQLTNNMEDDIRWRWTESGEYTTKSAYEIQFQGTFFQAQNYANLEGQDGTKMQILRMDTNAQNNSDRKQLDEARMDG